MSHYERMFFKVIYARKDAGEVLLFPKELTYDVGNRDYWNSHGWKVAPGAQPIGAQVIPSQLKTTSLYQDSDLIELRGYLAAERRRLFEYVHSLDDGAKFDWFYGAIMRPLLDTQAAATRTLSASIGALAGHEAAPVKDQLYSLGADLWFDWMYKQHHDSLIRWRISDAMADDLQLLFAHQIETLTGFHAHFIEWVRAKREKEAQAAALAQIAGRQTELDPRARRAISLLDGKP